MVKAAASVLVHFNASSAVLLLRASSSSLCSYALIEDVEGGEEDFSDFDFDDFDIKDFKFPDHAATTAALGEDPTTLEAVVEPYLLQLGFLQRTPRGRVVTAAGRGHLGWPVAEGDAS